MKKLLTILSLALVSAAFSSCKKEYITEAAPNQTILFNVPASSWTLSTDGKSDMVVINTPEITNAFNNIGGVLVYFSFTTGVYEQIPEVYNGVSYSYTHNQGAVVLYAQNPDGTAPVAPGVRHLW